MPGAQTDTGIPRYVNKLLVVPQEAEDKAKSAEKGRVLDPP